ncbi:aldo/keto reductase [Allokutzneria sp. A3M-2-11 16]|uniref:aldo/keto reductase n=1 Tax=Allokutzneria sp. A3M-2-11 16 TaxID=2962043 RepID=UPI0020B64A03|nr:aldo/keto reductase [Allokutzneria sp. A3M-2-11 16]MCP3803990.1 aldo/keto reductase [Allokutzneria sp. A3M-2-11 16]
MPVDRIGLGLAALGRPAYINLGREDALPRDRTVDAMRRACWQVLDAAYGRGVRWVDAARSYGRSEEFLAGWLADREITDVTVSSKWGYAYVADWRPDAEVHEVKEHSLARFTDQWAQTRALLGKQVSYYQVHSLTPDSPLFTDRALLEALAALAESGVRVGFSTSGPAQAETVDRALALDVFTVVQSTWNVLEPSAGPALKQAHDAGAHVLLKETVANGRLIANPPARIAELAKRHSVGPDAIAIAAALAQPWADTVLSGAASTTQLDANLRALDVVLDGLEDFAEPATEYWATRSRLAWN